MKKYLLWMLLLCATPVLAAITKVQSNATWNTSGGSCTVPLTNTVSTHLLAVWATWSPTSLTASVSDLAVPANQFPSAVGPTVQSAASTPVSAQIFYAKNITGFSGTDNVLVTFSGTATSASCVAVEYSGLDTMYPLDSVSAGYSTSGNPTGLLDSGTVAPANANLLLFGGGTWDAGSLIAGPFFTSIQSSPSGNSITEQQIVSGNNTLQRATAIPNPAPSGSGGDWLMQMAVFRDASWTVGGGWTPIRVGQILYASQFPGSELGAKINNAAAACPATASQLNCVISLQDLIGQQLVTSPIVITSHRVSLIGPGKNILTLLCGMSSGDCVSVRDAEFTGEPFPQIGPTIGGFTMLGEGKSGVNGIHAGDMLNVKWSDLQIFSFNDCTSSSCPTPKPIAFWWDNQAHYSEQNNFTNVTLANCTICWRISNTLQNANTTSFGYTRAINMIIQPGAGGVGLCVDGTTWCDGSTGNTNQPTLYHSFLDVTIEASNNSTSPAVPVYMTLEKEAYVADNLYNLVMEDNNNPPIHPIFIQFGTTTLFTGTGNVNFYSCNNSLITGQTAASINIWPAIVCGSAAGPQLTTVPTSAVVLANWGGQTAPSSVTGQWADFQFSVAAASCGSCTGATATITFPNSPLFSTTIWGNPPLYECKNTSSPSGGALLTISGEDSATDSTMVLRAGTVATNTTYKIRCLAMLQ